MTASTSPSQQRGKQHPSAKVPSRRNHHGLCGGSHEANRLALGILEVLAGACTPAEAAVALKLSLARYYLLEKRALDGLVAACQPKPLGKQSSPQTRIAALERALQKAQRQCARQEALVRAARRSVGLPAAPAPSPPAGGKRDRRGRKTRRATVRALKAAQTLRDRLASEEAEGVEPGALEAAVAAEDGRTGETPASS